MCDIILMLSCSPQLLTGPRLSICSCRQTRWRPLTQAVVSCMQSRRLAIRSKWEKSCLAKVRLFHCVTWRFCFVLNARYA